MMINQELKGKLIKLVRAQWKLFALGLIILLVLLVTLLIPRSKTGNSGESPGNAEIKEDPKSNNKSGKNPLDFFNLFSDSEEKDQKDVESGDKPFPTPHIGTQSTENKFFITNLQSGGTQASKTLSGITTATTTQGTISTHTNIQTDVNSNDEVDNIKIVFQNSDGTTTTYIPPGTPPDEVRWGRYTNQNSKYSINFPSNWQFFYSIDADGHEGIALYPPNTDPNNEDSPFIGFGITERFILPATGEASEAFVTPLLVDGISGSLYTSGQLGDSYIASVLQYSGKHFGLGSSISNPTFAYVYYYMLYSLTFNTQ